MRASLDNPVQLALDLALDHLGGRVSPLLEGFGGQLERRVDLLRRGLPELDGAEGASSPRWPPPAWSPRARRPTAPRPPPLPGGSRPLRPDRPHGPAPRRPRRVERQ